MIAMPTSDWPPPIRTLLDTAPAMSLNKFGPPDPAARQILKTAQPRRWFRDGRAPEAAVGALWLRHGDWDEAHTIIQDLPSTEAAYWHGILHRLDGDSANAAYWFRRTEGHALYKHFAFEAKRLAGQHPEGGFAVPVKWDAVAFVEFVDQVRQAPGTPGYAFALAIQEAEWQLLFDWCGRANIK
jgi:hypothetical protein